MTDDPFAIKPPNMTGGQKATLTPRAPVHEPIRPKIDPEILESIQNEDDDRLRIPKEMIPDGMDYQWVTMSILGKPEPQRVAQFERRGWTPVMAERHEGMFMPKGYKGQIEVDGLGLFERPLEYTKAARLRDHNKAREQVQVKEAQMRGGDVQGVAFDTSHPSARGATKVNKSYERFTPRED